MCGICGKLIFKNVEPSRELISTMCKTIVHRGPDDEGIYTAPHIGLGQRRLSIIDLTQNACPPLSNEEDSIWIVFNGEIYNYQELHSQLVTKGHIFKTNSDTEVIIHLYEDEGINCLQRLRGMFAFALWDRDKRILFCARDRLGKKPFCYSITPYYFLFGSEIKAITADPDVTVSPDFFAIDQYLTYQFVPSPLTSFEGIKRLRPGELLICDVKGHLKTQIYWEPPIAKKITYSKEEIEYELIKNLKESIKLRMISDVPFGAFLSGGIDSATIVALMAQESSKPVKTFSIGFDDEAFNELPYARLLAERYGTEHHELLVKPNAAEILPLLVKHYNEPFADASALPTYYVSKMTHDNVKVALSGDGGDESFAGYDNYGTIQHWKNYDILPFWLRTLIATGGKGMLIPFVQNNNIARMCRGLTMFAAIDVQSRWLQYSTILKMEEKQMAYRPWFKKMISQSLNQVDALKEYPWKDGMDELDWMMRHNQKFYLPDCLMVKTDIASMANSLEVRSPFLDHKFIEFAAMIDSSYKRDSKSGKIILKSAVRNLLPSEIISKHKTGFTIPIAKWFRNELAPLLKETLMDEKSVSRGLFEPQIIKKMVIEHIEGRRDWSNRLWAFLFLELWFREFID
jgi:asparagine synthase (glutamine-hydrolysing)